MEGEGEYGSSTIPEYLRERSFDSLPCYRMPLRLYTVVVPSFDGLVMFHVPPLLQNAGTRRLSDILHLLKLTV